MEWQPIETAPKDGTHLLLYRKTMERDHEHAEMCEAWWGKHLSYHNDQWGGAGWAYPDFYMPTHWMPLPEPPEAA